MSSPPQINATLTAVESPGLSEDYDRPAGSVTPKWTGSSGCYVREKLISSFMGPELNRVVETTLYIDPDLTVVDPGDSLVYTYNGNSFTKRVQNTVNRELPGAPSYLVATLEMENAG